MKKNYRIKWILFVLAFGMLLNPLLLHCPRAYDKIYGIDISRWQGKDVDFHKIKNDGIGFVILRAGYTGGKDILFEDYYKAAKEAGLSVGCYMYSYAESTAEAVQDAKDLKQWIKGKVFEYPVYYDMEDKCLLEYENEDGEKIAYTTEQRTNWALAFLDEMKKDDYYAGVYANLNWFRNYLDSSRLKQYPLWLALWTKDGTDSGDHSDSYGMWQYTSTGKVDGIYGNVDRDVCYVDYPAYIEKNGLNGFKALEYDPDLPFTDVKLKDWFYPSAKYTYENKLIAGTSKTEFSPDVPVTRAMFVSILGRMNKVDINEYQVESNFLDVDMEEYYGPYVMWAYENHVVAGMSDEFFAPDESLTREQMCLMISNYAAYQGITFTGEYENNFVDEEEISDWALDSVKAMSGAGILFGTGHGKFSPMDTATRAECAAIVYRIETRLAEELS
ncbi:MAG: hypothetical protein HFE77_00690 [Clostridiales bacterium]|nr:hypothetical protein [Clostridiales bacterium]